MSFLSKPEMRPEEFRLIYEFVAEEFGFILDESRVGFLTSKLMPRLTELRLESFSDYYAHLKYSPHFCEEHKKLLSLITNNETYFFREEAQLNILTSHVLPEMKEKKSKSKHKKIRIISAGCSSGEEVYTLAMILLESCHFLWDWDIRITGVDIDSEMIERARKGIYSGRAFQTTPPQLMERYFSKCDDGFQVKSTLKRLTSFKVGNLLRLDSFDREDHADIIFCRNVFIYFSEDTTRKIVENFATLLCQDGHLFLGHSESLSRVSSRYLQIRYPGAIIYRKRD
jgi:chemotaxis protein methyltransferase CheR